MLSDDQVKATILFKLHKRGNWGASHTAFDNRKKGFKDQDLGKHAAKRVDKLARAHQTGMDRSQADALWAAGFTQCS